MPIAIDSTQLTDYVSSLFTAAGLDQEPARIVAEGLVDADRLGLHSHGVMLADMYVKRLIAGSVSKQAEPVVVSDDKSIVVLDANHAFGVLTSDDAMERAVEKAKLYGIGVAAVRHGFHFGTARRFAQAAADRECIGIAICNTRPLMPAPGGAERVVGNNPIAIAVPSDDGIPLVLDMATSEAAMGKIRMAAKSGQAIPLSWAVKADGSPTSDPNEAINGMLLPSAGPKGFGLALMIDLMCGLLSGGAMGSAVQPLYGDASVPYDCSHIFIAIDLAHFGEPAVLRAMAGAAARGIRNGQRAPGIERLYTPGEPEWDRQSKSKGRVQLQPAVRDALTAIGAELGVSAPQWTII